MPFIWNYLKSHQKALGLVLVLAATNQIFSLLDPQVFRLLVDNYASQAAQMSRANFFSGVAWLLLAFIGVALVSRIAKNFQDYYVNVISNRMGAKLYAQSIAHSLSLPYRIFEDQRSGEILDKLQKARTDNQNLVGGLINILFVYLLGLLFVVIYAFWVNAIIGLVYLLIIPTLGSVIFLLSKKIKKIQQKIIREQADLAGYTTETLRNVELVKSLGLEEQEIKRLNKTNDKILQLDLERVRLVRTLSFVQGTLVNFLRAVMMLVMLWLIYEKSLSLGEFFSLLFYSFFLFGPLGELSNVAEQYQAAKASNAQLQQILNTAPEEQPTQTVALKNINSLEFKNVGFQYGANHGPAVKNINLRINPGQSVALVGPSGSGKSTLIKLLVRLYEPQSGQLLINGTLDSKLVNLPDYRRKIGFVAQETQLFSGTIRDNLLFVKPDASDQECLRCLEEASIDNILNKSRDGLDTKIGEGGIKLSGGERQRLAIARALLRRPDVLIFDEATSSLDSITEKQITQTIKNIEKSRPNMITIMVAHRLSTIYHAHCIYVLEKGQIVEQGPHDELLKKVGLYAALWREQVAISNNE